MILLNDTTQKGDTMKQKQKLLFSAEYYTNTKQENDRRTVLLSEILQDMNISYKIVKGVYKGIPEKTFVIVPRDNTEVETLKGILFDKFNQHSILEVNKDSSSYLIYKDKEEYIGRFTNVSSSKGLEAYTVDTNGQVWTAIKGSK